MKDFMFIFRGPSYEDLQLSPEESQAAMQKWFDWMTQLSEKNAFVAGDPLFQQGKMVSGTDMLITDGPFAEGKELVGGYLIIKAASLEEATELAKGFPDFHLGGSVEVREILKMDMPS